MTEHSHTEHRDRPDDELAAQLLRARAHHVDTCHDGDATACDCEPVTIDAATDIITADLAEDVDGAPLGVRVTRAPMTGIRWRSPRRDA